MKNIFTESLQETLSTKRSLKRNNEAMKEQIDKLMETLKEARDNEKYAISQMNKYKNKLRKIKKEMKQNENNTR